SSATPTGACTAASCRGPRATRKRKRGTSDRRAAGLANQIRGGTIPDTGLRSVARHRGRQPMKQPFRRARRWGVLVALLLPFPLVLAAGSFHAQAQVPPRGPRPGVPPPPPQPPGNPN